MKFTRTAISLLLLASLGVAAQTQPAKTQAQEKSELTDVIRSSGAPSADRGATGGARRQDA